MWFGDDLTAGSHGAEGEGEDCLDMSCKEQGSLEDELSGAGGEGGRRALFGQSRDYTWDRAAASVLLEESCVCSRIFRFALARVQGLSPQHFSIDKLLESLSTVHPAIVSLLLHIIEAEKVILPTGGKKEAGAESENIPTGSTGKKGKKRRRRVSFNTFDFSTIETPTLQRKGSHKQLEKFLSTLYQVLLVAEAVRTLCCQTVGVTSPLRG